MFHYSVFPIKWNSIFEGFVKKSLPNFHFIEFPFLNEIFSELDPEFPFSQHVSFETTRRAFGNQNVVFFKFKVVSFKIQVSNLRFLSPTYVSEKVMRLSIFQSDFEICTNFHFIEFPFLVNFRFCKFSSKFPFYRISISSRMYCNQVFLTKSLLLILKMGY